MPKNKTPISEIAARMRIRGSISPEQQEDILREALADPVIVESIQRAFSEPHPLDEDGAPMSFNPALAPGHEAFLAIVERIAPHREFIDESRVWFSCVGQIEREMGSCIVMR